MRNPLLLLGLLAMPIAAHASSCPAPGPVAPLQPVGVAPLSDELGFASRPLGEPAGVLSQAYDASLAVDRVLLRQQWAHCLALANAAPATGVVGPDNPAAYKPRTQYDNTPWRFNMSQNGKKMTADEFAAWMEARGVHVARGATPAAVQAGDPALPAPPPADPPRP
ncbi:MAG TPA: hypothetical protein VLM17_05895 [Xanthomonadaceae bacterium]|nr:hypothetical protein [Xanthomonadaceae bacterium]